MIIKISLKLHSSTLTMHNLKALVPRYKIQSKIINIVQTVGIMAAWISITFLSHLPLGVFVSSTQKTWT